MSTKSGSQQTVGAMHTEAQNKIKIQTNSGLFLYKGREKGDGKSYVMGFKTFMKKARRIEQAIRQDDPYADRSYYRIEQAYEQASGEIKAMIAGLQEIKDSHHPRFVVADSAVSNMVELPIREHSVLGWRALDVLLDADDAIKLVLDAHHIGRIGHDQKRTLLRQAEGIVRHMFTSSLNYFHTGVTRDDIAANNEVARQASDRMGQIEEEYLSAKVRSKYAPDLPKKRRAVMPESESANEPVEPEQVQEQGAA